MYGYNPLWWAVEVSASCAWTAAVRVDKELLIVSRDSRADARTREKLLRWRKIRCSVRLGNKASSIVPTRGIHIHPRQIDETRLFRLNWLEAARAMRYICSEWADC